MVTLGNRDFILSCSPRVCGENTGQHISMGKHRSLEKEPITQKKIEKVTDEKQDRSYRVFSPFQNETRRRIRFVFFPFNFEQIAAYIARGIGFYKGIL